LTFWDPVWRTFLWEVSRPLINMKIFICVRLKKKLFGALIFYSPKVYSTPKQRVLLILLKNDNINMSHGKKQFCFQSQFIYCSSIFFGFVSSKKFILNQKVFSRWIFFSNPKFLKEIKTIPITLQKQIFMSVIFLCVFLSKWIFNTGCLSMLKQIRKWFQKFFDFKTFLERMRVFV